MINIGMSPCIVGTRDVYVVVTHNHACSEIFSSEVLEMGDFENRDFGPA
jgi:hypothetical protein